MARRTHQQIVDDRRAARDAGLIAEAFGATFLILLFTLTVLAAAGCWSN